VRLVRGKALLAPLLGLPPRLLAAQLRHGGCHAHQ
jgi:hypothetical protein